MSEQHVVVLAGWKVGLSTIDLMKLVCERTPLTLREAKSAVERLVEGETLSFSFASEEAARSFAEVAGALGVGVRRRQSDN